MNNEEIIIIYQEVGKTPLFKKVKNNMSSFEELLNGKIDVIPYEDIVVICKQNRKNLQPNIYVNSKFLSIGETIRGNIILACRDEKGFISLTKKQATSYLEFLKNASFHYNNVDENGRLILSSKKDFLKVISRNNEAVTFTNNEQAKNDDILKMILAIQTIILKFIKNNEN